MPEYDLSFSSSSSTAGGSFKLLELPLDLCKLAENAMDGMNPLSLMVKGRPGEDAVLCTHDKTFSMRSVVLSNSILIVTSPPVASAASVSDHSVVIRDQLSEIIELVPSVPKLHKLSSLLRGKEYDEGQEDSQIFDNDDDGSFTYKDARAELQASDEELDHGLKERHIFIVDGVLRPIAPSYLSHLLELILNLLVSLTISPGAVPVEELTLTLADEYEIPRVISSQAMSWFGDIQEGRWKMDVGAVMREIGLGILRNHQREPIEKTQLMTKWKALVGDTFESSLSLSLLSGNYLASKSRQSDAEVLSYYPASSLPIDPAARFADLFLTRSRWKGEEIAPFLADIAINSKERDKFLLKYARAITDAQGVWYTGRTQYSG